MLSKHPDLCKFPHGHSRKVEFILETNELDQNEMVCDFKILQEAMADFLSTLDHALCMNTNDPMYPKLKEAYGDRIIDFPDEEALFSYRDHPTHLSFANRFMPLIDEVARDQYSVD